MDVADEAVPYQKRLAGRRSVGGIGADPALRVAERHIQFWRNSSKSTAAQNTSSRSPKSLSPFKPIVDVEKSQLAPHAVSSESITPIESKDTRIREVFSF
jgi:hypothetical protein